MPAKRVIVGHYLRSITICKAFAVATLVVVSGCSSEYVEKPTTTGVSGKVTLNGKPVTTGHVSFVPEKTEPQEGDQKVKGGGLHQADLDSSGGFTFTDAVTIGKYKVVVSPLPLAPSEPNPNLSALKNSIPQKYQSPETTDLSADVQSGGGEFKFELK